jgi:hypothetical protein
MCSSSYLDVYGLPADFYFSAPPVSSDWLFFEVTGLLVLPLGHGFLVIPVQT